MGRLYIRVEDSSGVDHKHQVKEYRFDGGEYVTPTPYKQGNKILCCACGHRDFNDNGRFINEYSCNGCGGFVEIVQG